MLALVATVTGWIIHNWQLCYTERVIRKQEREFIRHLIELGGEFNAPAIIGSMQGRIEGAVSRAQAIEWLREALDDLGEHAAERQQPLLFEPLNRYETNVCNSVGDAAVLLKTLRTQNIK